MKTNNIGTRSPAPELAERAHTTQGTGGRIGGNRWRLALTGGATSALLLPIAVALLLSGCGGHGAESASGDANAEVAAVQPVENRVNALPEPVRAQAGVQADSQAAASTESLAPDIVVSVADTLVSPGEPVEITARGTSDVVDIALWDGINNQQAFAYDSVANIWRVHYRVPLRPSSERLGLSVTAKNEAHRWRRLWVFLRVQEEMPQPQPEPVDGP